MKLTIPVKDLSQALATAVQAVEKKTTIPVMSCVCLVAKGGTLRIDASDLEQYVSLTLPAKVEKEGSICVDAKKLHGYVGLLPHAEVSLDVSPNHRLTVKCGKSRTTIGGMAIENFPSPPEPEKSITAYKVPGEWLTRIQQRIAFTIADAQGRYTLMAALLEFDKDLKTVATDGNRLAFLKLTPVEPFSPNKALASKAAINLGAKLFGSFESVKLSIDTNHLYLEAEGCLLISRKLSGQFPDYMRVLPSNSTAPVTVNREEMQGCLARVMKFANENSRAVRLGFNGELSLQTRDQDEADESLPFSGEASGIVGLNGDYVQDFLRAVGCNEIQMHVKDEESAVEMRESGDDSYRYVVMPMRV